jgi:transcription elongation factor Elf1
MACPVCNTKRLVEIGINLGDSAVTLHSCSKCETRWWERDGERVEVDGVLTLAAGRR